MGGNLFHSSKYWLYVRDLRVWVRQHESGIPKCDGGPTTAERQRLKELERENVNRAAATISFAASAYFARGGVRPPLEKIMPLLDKLGA